VAQAQGSGLESHRGITEVGGWTLGERLGAGAFGEVFLATRKTVAGDIQKVAIKLVRPADPSGFPGKNQRERVERAVQAFKGKIQTIVQEFRLLQRVDSPFIAPVVDSGQQQVDFFGFQLPVAWIALQYVPGQSLLEEINNEGVLTKAEWLDLAHDLLMAADAAHQAGVINSEIKPDNVMRSSRRTLLIDFGVGSVVGAQEFSGSGGTLGYRAPEQLDPSAQTPLKDRYESDIFSIGATLVYAGTGMKPWDFPEIRPAGDRQQVLAMIARELFATMTNTPPRLEGLDSE